MHTEAGPGGTPRRTPTSASAVPAPSAAPGRTTGADGQAEERLRVVLEVELPSHIQYVERVVELVRQQCEQLGFTPRQLMLNIPVALSEALSNAILRGNRQEIDKIVRLRAAFDGRGLVLEVHDQGPGFDLDAVLLLDPTADANLQRENGRGLFLMRKLMDGLERFEDQERHGNVVRLTLRRT